MGGTRRSPPGDDVSRADPLGPRDADATSLQRDVRFAVADALAHALPEGGRVAVALSGGRDSIALFDATVESASTARCSVVAFHVDHRLSVHAEAWSQFCREVCAARGVPCDVRRVQVERGPRVSTEAAARTARYAALADMAREHAAAAVLLAHHADDQAETLLLQLFRGAGPRGLAGMPAARFERGVWWLRPFLALPRARIEAYAARQALRYVDDESNDDSRHRRNALRNDIVPALRTIAPGYPRTLVRAAGLQAEAATLLDDLARLDAGDGYDGATLDVGALARLDACRARNVLRWFLRKQRLPPPSSARLGDLVRQLTTATADARIAVAHAGARVAVHRGRVIVDRSSGRPYSCEWNGDTTIVLPHGTLRLATDAGIGIAARHLGGSKVTIRSGVHGERLRITGRAGRRHVADLLREAGIPRWDRLGLPRVYCDDALAAVATLGVDAAFTASPGEPAFALDWRPAIPAP
jgi:tRNA(Ile)-lysidine synthase